MPMYINLFFMSFGLNIVQTLYNSTKQATKANNYFLLLKISPILILI